MIEEDDDEAILHKGITFKSAIKNFFVILLIFSGALFMYLGFGPDQWTNFFIGFMLICFGTTLMQVQKQAPEPLRQTLTILACALCGITKVRNFETGDFVFSRIDKCNKCNNLMEVKNIYSVRLKKQTELKKKQKPPKLEPEIKN